VLRGGLSDAEAHEAVVLLAALGVPTEVEPDPTGGSLILVSDADHPRAIEILAEADREAALTRAEANARGRSESGTAAARSPEGAASARGVAAWSWSGPHLAPVLSLVLACVAAFLWTTGGSPSASYGRMVELGAITAAKVDAGEVWRLVAAVFLHFDLAHLLANMGTLLLVGPVLARIFGPLRFAAVFVGAGVAGNVASYILAPTTGLKAGASGAVAGVIGALAGQALAEGRGGRFRRWQILGAGIAVYALLVGAGAGSDHVAHLGGLIAGVLLGRLLAPPVPPAKTAGSDELADGSQPA